MKKRRQPRKGIISAVVLKIGTIVSITIIFVGLDFEFTWDGMEGEGCMESSAALVSK